MYKLSSNPDVVIYTDPEGTIKFVPNDPKNSDWRDYQAWLAEDNEPEPADPIEEE